MLGKCSAKVSTHVVSTQLVRSFGVRTYDFGAIGVTLEQYFGAIGVTLEQLE